MKIESIINIICSIAALISTIIIAVIQYKQTQKMNFLEKQWNQRDEERRVEEVKSKALTFLSENSEYRDLIPLCVMAAMYDDMHCYHRKMYRDFCCFTKEIQNEILKFCKLDLCVECIQDFFRVCCKAVVDVCEQYFPEDIDIFYDGGKYIERSVTRYGENTIPIDRIQYEPSYMHGTFGKSLWKNFDKTSTYEMAIIDILSDAFNSNDPKNTPIKALSQIYDFRDVEGIEACQFATTIAKYVAIYNPKVKTTNKFYGCVEDGSWTINTMEDLFLFAMFEIYINLVVD